MKYISKKESYYNNLKVKINNALFINNELKNTKNLLDNVNGYSLDKEQRKAILTDEENILLLAGAGSGKTLTIVGKIRYLIEFLNIKKEEILCISFTNDSVKSLKNALLKNYNYDIDVYTFHKLSLNILKDNNKNISICDNDLLEYIVDEFFIRNLKRNKVLQSDEYKTLKTLIITFINLFKSGNYEINKFDEILKKLKNKSEHILIKIIKQIYIEYEDELKSTLTIDFNDMINYATKMVKQYGNVKKYKYIIIDEYQDTSYSKYELIKEIQNKTSAKLFVVGDDFQSIYRFTGCNLNIFLNFKKYFKYSKIMKITNTYRNSRELIKIVGDFIMKNKYQMKKILKSKKSLPKPIEIIYSKNIKNTLYKLISELDSNVLILGRNNNDIYKYFKNINNNGYINQEKNVRYLTIHKSKGLEEDNVIVINLEDTVLGLPSKIENNRIINFLLNEKDLYPYEEERRLFYVALTRTKNKVYLLVDRNNESIFVKELIKNYKKDIKITK